MYTRVLAKPLYCFLENFVGPAKTFGIRNRSKRVNIIINVTLSRSLRERWFAGDRGLEVRVHGFRPVLPVGVHSGLHSGHVRHNIPGAVAVRPTTTHRLPVVQHSAAPEQSGTAERDRLLRAHVRRRRLVGRDFLEKKKTKENNDNK